MFGERLKYLRLHHDGRRRTQEEMAKLMNIQPTTYGEYERGKIKPPTEKLNFLSNYFGVSVDYLLGNNNTKDVSNDISIIINKMIDDLESNKNNVVFEGETLDGTTRELLVSSLKNSISTGKLMKKVQNESKRIDSNIQDK